MTATVVIEEGNGASVTWTELPASTGRYCTTDAYNPGSTYPCVVPSASNYYSYWKHTRMAFSGTFTSLSNFRWYTSGNIKTAWGLGSGALLVAKRDSGDHGCPAANYMQAGGTQGTTGDYLKDGTNGHDYYKGQTVEPADADTCTSGSPLTFDSSTYSSAGATKSVVTQLKLATNTTQGDKANETFTIRYDEI